MNTHIMIPARYASSRLPGKVLLPFGDKTMLEHAYDRAVESEAGEVSILCDDPRVESVARTFCDRVYMTSPDCISGTQRITDVLQTLNLPPTDIIINLQADEPFIEPDKILMLKDLMLSGESMATLAHVIENAEDLSNPNVVKVVLNQQSEALYFSRALLPWSADPQPQDYYRHIGLYAYRIGFLEKLRHLPSSPLQLIEKLEQLTVLYHGYKIKVGVTSRPEFIDINTLEDYEAVVLQARH
jgi:3-deoxy-manno-octulosonate cytidylyltransferase (CMP-KDO synthetase)